MQHGKKLLGAEFGQSYRSPRAHSAAPSKSLDLTINCQKSFALSLSRIALRVVSLYDSGSVGLAKLEFTSGRISFFDLV